VRAGAVSAGAAPLAWLAFTSGLCALVYQTVWLRELRLVFGASTPASAAVLAAFMGGLGFGGLLLGRRAERSARPLDFYGRLEIGVALVAGVSPLTLVAARWLYLSTGGSATLGGFGAAVVRLLLTALVLGAATFLMGGTLPALGRAVTAAGDRGRRGLGWIYGCNTLGAVAGAALTTFLLLESFGQRKTLLLAALVNLLVGMVARSRARGGAGVETRAADDTAASARGSERAMPMALALAAAAMVGFAYFLMELVWYRMLAPLLGGTTYTFGIILMVALAGIGAGGLLYGAMAPRRSPSLADFAVTCGLEGLLLVVPLAMSHRLATLASLLRGLAAFDFHGVVLGWLVVSAIVVLPASLVAGYQFPLLVALVGAGRRELAEQTGKVAAANTLGAMAGSLAGGFGLLPLLGAPGAWRGATLMLAALALGAALLGGRRAPRAALGSALAALAAAALCLRPGPGALWRYGEIGAGRNLVTATSPTEMRWRALGEESFVVWEEDGRESSIALRRAFGYSFSVNGKTDGNARSDASTQVMAPLVGAMLHPAPRRALVVGLGTGSSAGWLAAVPGIDRVDVVELEPAVVRVARDCAPVNHGALENPRLRLFIGDGREFLLTRDERWDVIFSEPSNPYRAGVASLFTTEFYRSVADHLAPGGVFVQWIQGYEVDASVIASVYTSLGSVFPQIETWSTNESDLLLIASREPLRHDLRRVAARAAGEPWSHALADAWGVSGAEGFYIGFIAGPAFARRMATTGAAPNVDDRPVIEFGFARSLGRASFGVAQLRAAVRPEEGRAPGLEGLDATALSAMRALRALATAKTDLPPDADAATQSRWLGDVVQATSGTASADGGGPIAGSALAFVLAAETLAERGDPRAEGMARSLLAERPVEGHALLARFLLRTGRRDEGLVEVERSLVAYRRDPWPWRDLMRRLLDLVLETATDGAAARVLLPALSEPFSVGLFDSKRTLLRIQLAERAGGDACRAAFRAAEPNPIWTEELLRARAACYARTGDPLAEAAARDVAWVVAHRPARLDELLAGAAAERGGG